jgi:hypothetical protein
VPLQIADALVTLCIGAAVPLEGCPLPMFDVRQVWHWLIGSSYPPVTGIEAEPPDDADEVERPWLRSWDHLPKRTAGPDFSRSDYRAARRRAIEVARATLGDDLWAELQRDGYLELPSQLFDGITYRLRVGRRIEVRAAPGYRVPWVYPYLCINPTYPLPELEFFAQLYLYVRDREEEIVRVAAPQPWDQSLGRTF